MTFATGPARPAIYRIVVRDLLLKCRIGIYDHERMAPQRVLINVDLAVAETVAAADDDIANVYNYEEVINGTKAVIAQRHIDLVETLAEEIAAHCLQDARVQEARVRVEKLDVYAEAESVGIEIVRYQSPENTRPLVITPPGPPVYLEDLTLGQRFTSTTFALDMAKINAFAGQFDPQPFHVDEAAAVNTFFGGLAASGWHTAAITMRLLVQGGAPNVVGGLIGGQVDVTWPRPTRPGDELQVTSEILEITPSRSRPERGMVLLKSETKNQNGEVVQAMTSKLVVPRRG